MRATITSDDWLAIFAKMADDLEAAKDSLNALDAAVGDGDQGVTMTIGFRAVRDALPALRGQDVGTIVSKVGLAFNGKAASTIGALFATGCLRAGKEVRGKSEIDLSDLARMAEAALAGIRERGKAEIGDKTLLETLVPLSRELSAAAAEGVAFDEALHRSLVAAEEGMKSTIPLTSKIGRAAWLADRTAGHQDPGATSFYLMWKSTVDYLTSA
ncbi:MAG TPA: dihydroxyacetone kinase subunit DhaL [Chloroflexota bacterium]|nr:dihydroxyacetone kinase subunit DhaL [Chloroflexota bacterium]